MKNESSESDFLKYREDHRGVPFFLRIAWFLFAVFSVMYLLSFAVPDLRVWLGR